MKHFLAERDYNKTSLKRRQAKEYEWWASDDDDGETVIRMETVITMVIIH